MRRRKSFWLWVIVIVGLFSYSYLTNENKIKGTEIIFSDFLDRVKEKQVKERESGRSLYVVKDVKQGEEFTSENIRSIRPGFGMHPMHYEEVLGKKARRDIVKGEPLAWEHIE